MPPETTGQHEIPPIPAAPVMLPPPPEGQSRIAAWVLAFLLAVAGGAGSGYATSAAREAATAARVDQRVTETERRISGVESQLDGVEGLSREVAALRATMTAQNAALAQRLGRIEDALDRGRR